MSLAKKFLALAAPAALLAMSACTTGFPAQVSRFQAMPAPQGQSFTIQAADPRKRGGLEFAQYADLVRRSLIAQGYSEAAGPDAATLVVSLDYGVDHGRQEIETTPGFGYGGYLGYGGPFYRSRFGYYGRGYYGGYSPFLYGWNDPFLFGGYPDVHSYTVYSSFLDLNIRRTADGQSLFEGHAKAHSSTDALPALVPNLVEAMFTGFPGNSGETVKITVPPPGQAPHKAG